MDSVHYPFSYVPEVTRPSPAYAAPIPLANPSRSRFRIRSRNSCGASTPTYGIHDRIWQHAHRLYDKFQQVYPEKYQPC